MTEYEVGQWIRSLIEADNVHAFYTSGEWLHLKDDVLEEYKHECQDCKDRGKYTKATIVHHVKHLRKYPELALSKTYIDENGKEKLQLKPVCKDCHEYVEHPERLQWNKKKPLTEERW
jgi:5-methylcytosine-specific restriction endonuclease McrA